MEKWRSTSGEKVLSLPFIPAHAELLHHLGQYPPFTLPKNITVTFWKMRVSDYPNKWWRLFAGEGWALFERKESNITAQWWGNSIVLQAAGICSPWKPSSQGLTNYKSNSLVALRTGHWSPDTSVLQSHRNTQVLIQSVFLYKQSTFHTADISLCRFHHWIKFNSITYSCPISHLWTEMFLTYNKYFLNLSAVCSELCYLSRS